MKLIPFSKETAGKVGNKLCTRVGRAARIICSNAKGPFPVVALVEDGEEELPERYTENGYYFGNENPSEYDLMIKSDEGDKEEKTSIKKDMEKEFKFSPKDWVLVRDTNNNLWKLDIFSHLVEHGLAKYVCLGSWYKQCIPYEGNEHLLGHSDPYVAPFNPQTGDFVYVRSAYEHILIWHSIEGNGIMASADLCNYHLDTLCNHNGRPFCACCVDDVKEKRKATPEEVERILFDMHEAGIDWNAENKSIVNYSKTYEPKDGDFVVVEERNEKAPGVNQWICIFMSMSDVSINFHVGLALNGSLINGGRPGNYKRSCKETFRPATEEEKMKIVEQLAKIGEKWNAETKTTVAVEPSYEPKEGDFVVFIPDRVPCIGIFKRSYTDGSAYSEFHACTESVPSSTEVRLDATFRGNYKFRPAYQYEKSSLLGKLWKEHRQWDAEKHAVTYCEAWSEVRRGGIYEVWHDGKMRLALVKELTDYGYLSVFFSYDPEKQVSGTVFWDGVSVPFDKLIEVPEKDTRTALFRNFMHKTGCFYDKKSGRFYDFRKEYVDGEICWFLSYQPELNKFITNRFNLRYTLRSFLQIANGNIFRTEDQANERASELNQFLKK